MHHRLSQYALAAAGLFMVTASAQAHFIDNDTSANDSGALRWSFDSATAEDGSLTSPVAGAHVIDFNDGTCGAATCSGNYRITQGLTPGLYAPPGYFGSTGRDSTPYLATPRDLLSPQISSLSLNTKSDYFGLYWGSASATNTLSFLNDGRLVSVINGSLLPATGGVFESYVNFWNLPIFDTVLFDSTPYFAFEVDNVAYNDVSGDRNDGHGNDGNSNDGSNDNGGSDNSTDVPEPGSLALFGLGLIGMGWWSRRRQRRG